MNYQYLQAIVKNNKALKKDLCELAIKINPSVGKISKTKLLINHLRSFDLSKNNLSFLSRTSSKYKTFNKLFKSVLKKHNVKKTIKSILKSDVIVYFSDTYAVGLKYDKSKNSAPVVVFKENFKMTNAVLSIAQYNNSFVFERPILCSSLFDNIDVGDEVTYKFYIEVAELFSLLYLQDY